MADKITVDVRLAFVGGYTGDTRNSHITFYDHIGDTSVQVKLTPELAVQIISQLASTLK